jgi:hypothetical protein
MMGLQWFFNLLEKHGRKYVRIDAEYNIVVEKYVLFGSRENGGKRKRSIVLHHFIRNAPDFMHSHGGDYVSFILKGGYTEQYPNGDKTYLPSGIAVYAPYDAYHSIIDIEPGTWTLFCMGPFKAHCIDKTDGEEKVHKDAWHKVDAKLLARLEALRYRAARRM